ncbi:serine protease [Bacillus tianshenii]|nr:serine protease [Bacillus tianshenii]
MNEEEKEKFSEHLNDLKRNEPDLYEDPEEIEKYFNQKEEPLKKEKQPPSKLKKSMLIIVALFLIISTAGTLLNVLNLPALEFLSKSSNLSQEEKIQTYKKSVVMIQSENRNGTGFNISSEGLIVTNYHIVRDNGKSVISFPDGTVLEAKVLHTSKSKDLALLSVNSDKPLPHLDVKANETWQMNDPIYVIGNPLSYNQVAIEGTIVGEKNKTNMSAMLIDAPIHSGNSGSPVIDEKGKVIGIIYAKGSVALNEESKKVGFAIPAEEISNLLNE